MIGLSTAIVCAAASCASDKEPEPPTVVLTEAGDVVTLFSKKPRDTLVLPGGELTARVKDEAVEFDFAGKFVGSCDINVDRAAVVRAGHKDGHVFIMCDDEAGVVVSKFTIGKTLKHVGWATALAETPFESFDALDFDAPTQ